MEISFHPMMLEDIDPIFDFEMKILEDQKIEEGDRMIASWSSRWRKEQIQHYANLGWSYTATQNGKIVGYFLAQPIMFFEGLTQTLWIDHANAMTPSIYNELMQLAWKLSRDKNFQRVYISQCDNKSFAIENLKLLEWNPNVFYINHPRMSV